MLRNLVLNLLTGLLFVSPILCSAKQNNNAFKPKYQDGKILPFTEKNYGEDCTTWGTNVKLVTPNIESNITHAPANLKNTQLDEKLLKQLEVKNEIKNVVIDNQNTIIKNTPIDTQLNIVQPTSKFMTWLMITGGVTAVSSIVYWLYKKYYAKPVEQKQDEKKAPTPSDTKQ